MAGFEQVGQFGIVSFTVEAPKQWWMRQQADLEARDPIDCRTTANVCVHRANAVDEDCRENSQRRAGSSS